MAAWISELRGEVRSKGWGCKNMVGFRFGAMVHLEVDGELFRPGYSWSVSSCVGFAAENLSSCSLALLMACVYAIVSPDLT